MNQRTMGVAMTRSDMNREEQRMQIELVWYIDMTIRPGAFYLHVPNEGKRSKAFAGILKAMGLKGGASDLIGAVPPAARFWALELKDTGKKPTDDQLDFLAAVNAAGGYSYWTDDIHKAIEKLREWRVIR